MTWRSSLSARKEVAGPRRCDPHRQQRHEQQQGERDTGGQPVQVGRGQHQRLLVQSVREWSEAGCVVEHGPGAQLRPVAELVHQLVRMQVFAGRAPCFEQAGGQRCRKGFQGIEHRRRERPFGGRQAGGDAHQDRQDQHRLRDDLERLEPVEVVADPLGRDPAARDAGERHQQAAGGQHPARIDPPQVQERSRQRQAEQQRYGHQQRQRRGLQRPVAVHAGEMVARYRGHRGQQHHRAGQREQSVREVAARQQLQPEERQRMKPFVDEEGGEQGQAACRECADRRRLEAVEPVGLQQRDDEHRHGGESGQESGPVERAEPFGFRCIGGQAIADRRAAGNAERHDLPERQAPVGEFGP